MAHRRALLILAVCAINLSHATSDLEEVVVIGHYENAVGTSDAASAGSVTSKLIESRPALRPGEILEFVPGVVVTQHSGDGKANQYFLRGFNLDHGTDFATSIDGVPVNMPSHAHGQGYTDLNFLIPELIERIDYRKGPYSAEDGDFASAGSARLQLMNTLPKGIASLTVSEHNFTRVLLADAVRTDAGTWLFGAEYGYNNGPWNLHENFNKKNGLIRFSHGDGASGYQMTLSGYDARWRSTDQIPMRAVEDGTIDRFGVIDPTDGGDTARYSLALNAHQSWLGGTLDSTLYGIRSRLTLFSNFTYLLDDPVHGDQFEQTEHRSVYGLNATQSWHSTSNGRQITTRAGMQSRFDNVDPLALQHTAQRIVLDTVSESSVREVAVGAFVEQSVQWNALLRSVIGARFDHYRFTVGSNLRENSGTASDNIVSPKLSLIFRPWQHSEFFANYGEGFHSNDARGTTETITPREHLPSEPVTPLVKTRGAELGLRTEMVAGLQTSLALWRLNVESELVFSGDAGDTEPSRPGQRRGIELSNHYIATSWLMLDLDLSLSHARYDDNDPAGPYIPDAIEKVASFGMTISNLGPWYGGLQWRYFGPRPLIEDNSVRSRSTALAYLDIGRALPMNMKLELSVFNIFDRKGSDIDYFYTSRLAPEPDDGVDDVHFHPVEPRSIRVKLTKSF